MEQTTAWWCHCDVVMRLVRYTAFSSWYNGTQLSTYSRKKTRGSKISGMDKVDVTNQIKWPHNLIYQCSFPSIHAIHMLSCDYKFWTTCEARTKDSNCMHGCIIVHLAITRNMSTKIIDVHYIISQSSLLDGNSTLTSWHGSGFPSIHCVFYFTMTNLWTITLLIYFSFILKMLYLSNSLAWSSVIIIMKNWWVLNISLCSEDILLYPKLKYCKFNQIYREKYPHLKN